MTDQNSLEQFDQRLVALFHDVTNVSPDSPKYDPNILRSPMADALDDPDITEEEMVLYREWLRQDVAHQRKFIASLVQSSIRMQSSVVPAAQKLMRLEEEAIDKMLSFFSESNEGLLIDTLNGNISPEVLQAAEEFFLYPDKRVLRRRY